MPLSTPPIMSADPKRPMPPKRPPRRHIRVRIHIGKLFKELENLCKKHPPARFSVRKIYKKIATGLHPKNKGGKGVDKVVPSVAPSTSGNVNKTPSTSEMSDKAPFSSMVEELSAPNEVDSAVAKIEEAFNWLTTTLPSESTPPPKESSSELFRRVEEALLKSLPYV